ncbi:MAG: hydrogenase [Deltaproteobacteria bacterium]|nr:hydrogenase [Deltaproteobacteria bacterium]
MNPAVDSLLVIVLLLNFLALGTTRIFTIIRAVALQGVLLGLLPVLVRGELSWHTLLLAAAPMALKGVAIPAMLFRAVRDTEIRREMEPLIGVVPSLLLGAAGTAAALLFSRQLPLLRADAGTLVVPAALATALAGFVILTGRSKAISQVLGYLLLENGIFVFGLVFVEPMPLLVEFGVLLDLFVCIFVMGMILHHISREFSSLNTRHLSALKD